MRWKTIYETLSSWILFEFALSIWYRYGNIKYRLLDVIEQYTYRIPTLQSMLTSDMIIFRNAKHDFGRESIIINNCIILPLGVLLFFYIILKKILLHITFIL